MELSFNATRHQFLTSICSTYFCLIPKAIKGNGFRGALEYDLSKEHGRLIDTNMEGAGPRELAREFGEIRKLRPNLGRAVLHVSLSAAPGEHLTDAQWIEIGQRYLHGMGLDDNQYLITRHNDTEHEHIHLLVNRIRFDGEVTSDSHDYRRHEVLMRAIERDYALQPVQPSIDAVRRAATKGEIEQGLRTGVASTRQRLQQLCDGAVSASRSYSDYAERLEAAGVDLVPVTQLDGTKLSGLSYRLDGVMMKGSDLGKGYSPAGLAKRGIIYEKDRDLAAVGRQRKREEHYRPGHADRDAAHGEDRERGSTGIDAGADRAGDGGADGRDAQHPGRDRAEEPGAQRTVRTAGDGRGDGGAARGDDGEPFGSALAPCRPEHGMDALSAIGCDRDGDSGPRERILALAGTADRGQSPGRGAGGRIPAARDRSLEAVKAQIGAMGAGRYEVVIVNAKTQRQTKRDWSTAELLKGVAWLKRLNAQGGDIYVRPLDGPELLLVDALNAAAVEDMRKRGLAPAITVETSPGLFQVWVKLSDHPLPEELRKHAVSGLARVLPKVGQQGRLAGFTNQQVQPNPAGRQPFALAHEVAGKVALAAQPFLAAIDGHLRELAAEKRRLIDAEKALRVQRHDRGRSR
jgi:hypothetical protein